MPKDRMALLADPKYEDLLYVAGNAAAVAWRVNVTTGIWTKMWDAPDVMDGYFPHGDCRNYAWDHIHKNDNGDDGRLLLVSDGGIFASPASWTGGVNVVLNSAVHGNGHLCWL